jgi:hypothetical protein
MPFIYIKRLGKKNGELPGTVDEIAFEGKEAVLF